MNKLNKKGFTLVELVIVIAVIAILDAVLIPTFSGVVEKANRSTVLQAARSAYEELLARDLSDGLLNGRDGNKLLASGALEPGDNPTYEYSKITIAYGENDTTYDTFIYTDKGYTVTFTEANGWGVNPVA